MYWAWRIRKINPYHDERGRFTDAANAALEHADADYSALSTNVFDLGGRGAFSLAAISRRDPAGLKRTRELIAEAQATLVTKARSELNDAQLQDMQAAADAYLSGNANDIIADYLRNDGKVSARFAAARLGSGSPFATVEDAMADLVKNMDRVFKYTPRLKEDRVLWRGLKLDLRDHEWLRDAKPGMLVTDKSYLSTSEQRELAAHFAEGVASGLRLDVPSGTPHMLRIVAPKGTPVLPDASHGVSELVLPRNSVFVVTAIETVRGKGRVISLRMLPHAET